MRWRVTFNGNYAVSPALNPQGTEISYVTRSNGQIGRASCRERV